MACSIMDKNGHRTPPPKIRENDVKIVVVGERKCGKSKFIEAFYDKNPSPDYPKYGEDEYARIYPCRYEIFEDAEEIKIFEIIGGPDQIVETLTERHTDTNGFIFMYAIDDPLSFQKICDTWYPVLKNKETWGDSEPAIVVGTKRDLRGNQQVINRLALINEAPVTVAQGESLVGLENIHKYFDCSYTESCNIDEAFDYILKLALVNLHPDKSSLLELNAANS